MKQVHLVVSGLVQGVMFRAFVRARAGELSLTGWVRNLEGGEVEVVAEGEEEKLKHLVESCRKGPPHSHIAHVHVDWKPASCEFHDFRITW